MGLVFNRSFCNSGTVFAFLATTSVTVYNHCAQAEPLDAQGRVGATSYQSLPFEKNVYNACWLCSPDVEPAELFYTANPGSDFLNVGLMSQVHQAAASQSASGVVPASGAQRWEDTYEASFPTGTFPGEPSWIQQDRANGNFPNRPEFVAWRNFIGANPQYQDIAVDGGTMPNYPNYFRSWGGQWGWISPLTPLKASDCPPDMPSGCTWGDSYAYRWALTSQKTGGYGIMLSDFSDSQPSPSMVHDFNAGILAAFSKQHGLQPKFQGMGLPQAAALTNAAYFTQWTGFLDQGFANFYHALATRITAATATNALVIDQGNMTPSYRRLIGIDERFMAKTVGSASYMCIWDNQVIQVGRAGPIQAPIAGELAGASIAAAREPLVRNGANLEADDAAYWSAIASFYPTLSAADQKEVGYKLLKRLWSWQAWSHIADRSGLVRRALAFTSRDYWDVGTLSVLDPLTSLIQTVVPTAPFGPALYYSKNVEHAFELAEQSNPGFQPYLPSNVLQQFIDAGGGFGYYVSDAALPTISKSAGNAPSAWLVVGAGTSLPASELARLGGTAPVVTTPQALAALSNQPFRLSAGLTGFAFKDQTGRIIVVVSNPSAAAAASAVSGTVALSGLNSGAIKVEDLMANTSEMLSGNGTLTIPVSLPRWDTQILAISVQ